MLDLQNVCKTFNPGTVNEKLALENVSLHLNDGDFATIVGSNGAGKSTLFNAIAGEFIADTGTITLDGQDITFLPDYKRSKAIGRMFQDPLRGTAPHKMCIRDRQNVERKTSASAAASCGRSAGRAVCCQHPGQAAACPGAAAGAVRADAPRVVRRVAHPQHPARLVCLACAGADPFRRDGVFVLQLRSAFDCEAREKMIWNL